MITPNEAIEHLNNDGILIYPTDTVYGIGCLTNTPSVLQRLCDVKKRPGGFIVLVDSWARYQSWIDTPLDLNKLNTSQSTTWVFPATKDVPLLLQKNGEIAIRQVTHPTIYPLLQKIDTPLVSTSANLPGQPPTKNPEELPDALSFPIMHGECGHAKPSRIIHYLTNTIIRP